MVIGGRLIAGIGCGMILSVVPVYIAEISPPESRGFVVGLQGMMIAIGFAFANWVGYAGSFAKGNAQWRIPLGMQIPAAVLLTVAAIFIPFSPRWLIQNDRNEEARKGILPSYLRATGAMLTTESKYLTSFTAPETHPWWTKSLYRSDTRLPLKGHSRASAGPPPSRNFSANSTCAGQ